MQQGEIKKLVFPTWIMHKWPLYMLAFCSIRGTVFFMAGILFSVEIFFVTMFFITSGGFPLLVPAVSVFATFGVLFGFFLYLFFSKTFVISKDCLNCQFGFHIITHETIHIRSSKNDEFDVEQQALAITRDRLMPLLKGKPKLCSYCIFNEQFYKDELETYYQSRFDCR